MTHLLNNEQDCIERYKLLVEEKLNWGNSNDWRHQDFESLSEKIFQETGVMLSSTTLKRVWGKLKYDSIPNTNTLNALAAFIGHENWLEFKTVILSEPFSDLPENGSTDALPLNTPVGKQRKRWLRWAAYLLVGSIVLAFGLGFILKINRSELSPNDISKITFTSTPVAKGIPNTVVFKYDLSHLTPDKVEIQQSWDKRLRFDVEAGSKEATSIYYYPGYFRAKLLVDGQVTKEHDLYIKSEGWLATLNSSPKPRYFLKEELKNAPFLGVQDSLVAVIQTREGGAPPAIIGFHYVDDFGELNSDNFTLEATFKNTYDKGNGVCQFTSILVLCTEGALIIPFSIPGCVGDLRLLANDVLQEGKNHDLSAFGCDFSQWQNMKLKVQNRKAFIFLNGQLIHQLSYEDGAGRVVGFRFLFTGSGELDDVRLSGSNGAVVFEEDFEKGD